LNTTRSTNEARSIGLTSIKTSSFSSNVQRFPCKRCGITIALDAMVDHANVCVAAAAPTVSDVPSIDVPPGMEEDPVSMAARKSAKRRGALSAKNNAETASKVCLFQCQLCNNFVPVCDMDVHPLKCLGIHPTGMFWGKDTNTKTSGSIPVVDATFTAAVFESNAPASVMTPNEDETLSSEGIATEDEDDDDDDEPFLVDGGSQREDDFSKFAKTWRFRHTIIEDDDISKPSFDGFFTEAGLFVPGVDGTSEEEESSSEGIATSDEDFSDDDDEPLLAEEESELERVLRDGLRDVTKEVEQLVFA